MIKAGAYIRGQHKQELYFARMCDTEAQQHRQKAAEAEAKAEEHRQAAARWARGTDIADDVGSSVPGEK